jgi:hypothetical protein
MKYLIFMALLMVSFCTRSNDGDELSVNKSKWNSKNISDYEFTLRINCFCTYERVGPHLIKIVNDKILSVNNLPYDPDKTGELYTIDQLFTLVETSIERKPYLKTIEYNSTYGYPQTVWFDFNKTMADEEIGYQVSDFKEI